MWNKGIKTKLIVSLVGTTLIVLTGFFVFLNNYLKDQSMDELESTILFLGRNASSLLQKALFHSDYNEVTNIAQSIYLDKFDYLLIFDYQTNNTAYIEDPKHLWDGNTPKKIFQNRSNKKSVDLDFSIKEKRFIQYQLPIILDGTSQPLGLLAIGISKQTVQERLQLVTYRLLFICVVLFLTFTVIISWLANKFTEPLKILTDHIAHFAAGHYSVRCNVKTQDEVGLLSENFNRMADKINEQLLSIEQYNKNLEKMVEERTHELRLAIEDIKDKDRKLSQAEKLNSLNSIVSSIAHEFNNPLTIISGNIQLIDARVSDENVKRKLHTAQDAIQRIAKLIDEISFFSSIRDLTMQPFSFSSVLAEAIAKVVPGSVKVTIEGSDKDSVFSNAHLLTICLENILQNSVDQFIRRKQEGHIRIQVTRNTRFVVVEIIDNGGGIAQPSRVFEPFYTTFNEKKGLGMTFVYHVIQALNGEITLANVQDGARVTLKIPFLDIAALEKSGTKFYSFLRPE